MSAHSRVVPRGSWLAALTYPLGLGVAFVISAFTAMCLILAGAPVWLVHPATGFIGVFAGSLCLARCSRLFGSVFFLFAGLAYYYLCFVRIDQGFDLEGFSNRWVRLLMLFFGGLFAVVVIGIWQSLRKTVTRDGHVG